MANTGVSGRIVIQDESGTALSGTALANLLQDLIVKASDDEVLFGDQPLGEATPDTGTGQFNITYPAGRYGLEGKPDIRIRIYDWVGRLIHESDVRKNVEATTLDVGDITLKEADAAGWLVTLRKGVAEHLSTDNTVEALIDNETAWEELVDDVSTASTDVNLLLFYYGIGEVFEKFTTTPDGDPDPLRNETLEDKLLDRAQNDVDIRFAVRQNTRFFPPIPVISTLINIPLRETDSSDEIRAHVSANFPAAHSEVRLVDLPLTTPMHGKLVVVDCDKAHVMGSPIHQEYLDGPEHRIKNGRRGRLGHPVSAGTTINRPIHETSLRFTGPAVRHFNETFALAWNQLGDDLDLSSSCGPEPTPSNSAHAVQVVRTLPGGVFDGLGEGETGVLEAYLRAIRNAETYIYLATQYFTEEVIADALVEAVNRKPSLEVIMLINFKVDIPLYEKWQRKLLARVRSRLNDDAKPRFGIFTLWTHEVEDDQAKLINIYIHSQLGIVDDKWATVGTANLDGTSLTTAQHIIRWTDDDQHKRSVEVNGVIYNDVAGQPAGSFPSDLRQALWKEHLYSNSDTAPDLSSPPAGQTWLQLWNERSQEKLDGLKSAPTTVHDSRVLVWPLTSGDDYARISGEVLWLFGTTHSEDYIESNGVDLDTVKVLDEAPSYNFDTHEYEE